MLAAFPDTAHVSNLRFLGDHTLSQKLVVFTPVAPVHLCIVASGIALVCSELLHWQALQLAAA